MPRAEILPVTDDNASLGRRLAAAREAKGLEIEKAAHDTRIRLQRLKDLEADDYSRFPHPSYARMFLADYAKYLGIPAADIRSLLPESGDCGAGGYHYIDTLGAEPSEEPVARRMRPRRRVLPVLVSTAALLIISVLAINLTVTLRKLERLGLDQPIPPQAAPVAEPAAPPQPVRAVEPEDLALLNETLAKPAPEAFTPANLATPAPTPAADEGAIFAVGTLDAAGRLP
jgi:cytoskeleton protein RodZ